METDDIIRVSVGVVLIILALSVVCYTLYSAISYWDIKAVIKDCDRDFGQNQWVFYHDDDYIGCSHNTSIVNSNSKCYINGVEVECT